MKRSGSIILLLCCVYILLTGCNTTKFVPEGKYLLYKTKVVVEDTKQVSAADLSTYLRQKPNTAILGFWHLQLDIYNTAPLDTTTKHKRRLARNAQKMGESPEIYDPILTETSVLQLQQAMYNKGFFDVRVDTVVKIRKRKVDITYHVEANEPYKIKSYRQILRNSELKAVATDKNMGIKTGERFDTEDLDAERARISRQLRNSGFYFFDKSLLRYEVDSNYNSHEVSIEMKEQDYITDLSDSVYNHIYTRQYISKVCFHLDYDPARTPSDVEVTVDTSMAGYEYSYIDSRMLRPKVLRSQCRIRPGARYSEHLVDLTYARLNALGPVKYVDISFTPVASDSLECHITISRGKLNSVSAEIEGTYSAGDWGIAVGAGYVNKNIFRGAEQLSLNLRTSYEWRQNGGKALEAKAEVGLKWPNSLQVNIAYQYQQRPDEYTRTIANAGLYYTLHQPRSRWQHKFNFIDISYIKLPWVSEQFKIDILDRSSVLRYSYSDHFIVDWSYSGTYSNKRQSSANNSYLTFGYSIETAGNLLYGLSKVIKLKEDEQGQFEIFNVPFSQYVKADVNFTYNQLLREHHHLVYHVGIGAAVPYLNASAVPFEKRYFSGGSNSVRGWQARTLGPGAYKGASGGYNYDLQAGDIRLDLNLEYRWNIGSVIELAAFTDAGNIWTIHDYATQPHGVFRFDEFYKQLAWSYGVGIRLDFTILIFRVDFGVKLHDPTRTYTDGKVWRTAANGLGWKDDMTFHFAIGHPF